MKVVKKNEKKNKRARAKEWIEVRQRRNLSFLLWNEQNKERKEKRRLKIIKAEAQKKKEKEKKSETSRDLIKEIETLKKASKPDELRAILNELKRKYLKLNELRGGLVEQEKLLEEKEEDSFDAVATGASPINLKPFHEEVKKMKKRIKAQESSIKISEKRAKRKFPEKFSFL